MWKSVSFKQKPKKHPFLQSSYAPFRRKGTGKINQVDSANGWLNQQGNGHMGWRTGSQCENRELSKYMVTRFNTESTHKCLYIKRHFRREMDCFSLKSRTGQGLRQSLAFYFLSFWFPFSPGPLLSSSFLFSFTLNRYYFYVNELQMNFKIGTSLEMKVNEPAIVKKTFGVHFLKIACSC